MSLTPLIPRATSRSKTEVQEQLVSTIRNNQVSSFYVDETGDETVITLDTPIMATLDAPVAIVQIAHNQGNKQKFDYLLKSCKEMPSGLSVGSVISMIGPSYVLSEYFRVYKGRDIDQRLIKETLIEKPKHGEIKLIYESEHNSLGSLHYIPFKLGDRNGNVGYEGKDRAVYLLEFAGKRYKLILNLIVTESGDLTDVGVPSRCPADKLIKLNSLFNLATPDAQSLLTYDNVNITFANLTGAAVGEATGEGTNASIILDIDAAGHGWYIGGLTTEDRGQNLSTPSSIFNPLSSVFSPPSSDWLPTSNPNEWVARAGTDAAGKMDMLSVLLHEYGHALGIDHSSDSHDYMATTLTPGMRRLPSSDEMQLMAQLAGEARDAIMAGQGYTLTVANNNTDSPSPAPTLPINIGFGISFLGLLRRNSSASSIFANAAPAPAQYDIAANATLTNGNFAVNNTNVGKPQAR